MSAVRFITALFLAACSGRAPAPPGPSPSPAGEAAPSRAGEEAPAEPNGALDPARIAPEERRWRPQRGRGRSCASRYSAGIDDQLFEHELDADGRSLRRRTRSENMQDWATIERAPRTLEVDAAARVVRARSPDAPLITYTYDAAGRVVRVEGGPVGVVTCTYGEHGWPIQATEQDLVRTYVYDDAGRLLGTVTEEEGVQRTVRYLQRDGEAFVEHLPERAHWPESRHRYEGECADVFFAPCSRTYAPPFAE